MRFLRSRLLVGWYLAAIGCHRPRKSCNRDSAGDDALNRHGRLRVWNVVLRMETEGTAVFTYEEWQRGPDGTMRGRLSTVVFAREARDPNGLRWRHVHETWLPSGQSR